MSTLWHRGIPWYDKALSAAEHRGPDFVEMIETVADAYRRNVGSYAVGPEVDPRTGVPFDNRVRVTAYGHSAVISQPDGVVIGFGLPTDADRAASRTAAAGVTRGRGKARKATRRGPRDWPETDAWLRAEGYSTTPTSGGHIALLDPDGNRVYTLPSTPSDHRSLANCVSDIRRITGLELRR